MADQTNISWADGTANFWIGCTKISSGCDFCYAERDWDKRRGRVQWGPHGNRSFVKAGEQVVRKAQRGAAAFIAKHGRKPRLFINSLSDIADNHKSISPEWRALIWQLARECPDVIFMLLTKRPQNYLDILPPDWGEGYANVWLGTTAEDQTEADRRIPDLLATRAAVRFLSCEPLLGPVDLTQLTLAKGFGKEHWKRNALTGDLMEFRTPISRDQGFCTSAIDWVIAGGESGPEARPAHPDWFRDLRDQCALASVPYHFKQWGEWTPGENVERTRGWVKGAHWMVDSWAFDEQNLATTDGHTDDEPDLYRVGKKAAGRLLDGVTHDGLPV